MQESRLEPILFRFIFERAFSEGNDKHSVFKETTNLVVSTKTKLVDDYDGSVAVLVGRGILVRISSRSRHDASSLRLLPSRTLLHQKKLNHLGQQHKGRLP